MVTHGPNWATSASQSRVRFASATTTVVVKKMKLYA
jgi:hypothetical protein